MTSIPVLPDRESDFITIQSSELFLLKNELANVGSRAFAFLIDFIIRGLAILFLVFLFGTKVFAIRPANIFFAAFLMLLWNGYFIFFETIFSGKSPGKMFVGIRVVKHDGSKITVLDSCIRNVMRIVDMLPSGYMLALCTMFFEPYNRRPGDIVADTIVIYDRSSTKSIRDFVSNMLIESKPRASIQISGLANLSEAEKIVIKKLYSRLGTMKNGLEKDELMYKFRDKIGRKVTFSGTNDPEVLLCELYKRI